MDLSRSILSDITIHMKYAKYIPEKQRREVWSEIVDRNKEMHLKKFPLLSEEIENAYKLVYDKKVLPSMRSLQFAGKPIEVGPQRIYNCAYLPIDDWRAFQETMFLLLSGTGVGFSVQKHHVEKLPEIRKPNVKKHKRWLIADSIEGWADAIKVLMKSYFTGGGSVVFDYRDIRPKGARLVTSGGKAPGPQPLRECIVKIEGILSAKDDGSQLTPLEVHDIVCHIADAVLAGGIRRAALISFFSADDDDMISCKSGTWWEINPQRGRANNSAVLVRHRITKKFLMGLWDRIEKSGAGEPGIYLTNDKNILSNPCCIAGDCRILTSDGYKEIKTLDGVSNLKLVNRWGEIVDGEVWKTGTKQVKIIKFGNVDNPEVIKLTPDHIVIRNNSEECRVDQLNTNDRIHGYRANGEREIIFNDHTILSIEDGDAVDVYDFSLHDTTHWGVVEGVIVHNCEISLKPFSFCNLCEINASDIESQEDFNNRVKAATLIGTMQASYTNFHYLRPIWQKTTEADSLLGIGMTGIASNTIFNYDIEEAASVMVEENRRIAGIIGINTAARMGTVKPSGTSSLVVGSSSGIHAWHAKYYIRRIRVGKNEAIYTYLLVNHPELLEDDYFRPHDTAIISIPQKAPDNAILRDESPLDLLERVKVIRNKWIIPSHQRGDNTHNVSVTVSIKPDEWKTVGDWMWDNREHYNGISVLPYDAGTYIQAPFEDITEEKYNELVLHLHSIDLSKVVEMTDNTDLQGEIACGANGCEIK